MIRIILAILCLLLAVWYLTPIFRGVLHIGMLYPSAILLLLSFCLFYPAPFLALWHSKWKALAVILCVGVGLASVGTIAVNAVMFCYNRFSSLPQNGTVILLGCQVKGETPSLMLQKRMDKAIEYLKENPAANCVLSGGQGPGERISEAQAMFNYMTKKGIESDRLFLEDQSKNTDENIRFSMELMQKQQLPDDQIVIATDGFHELRAGLIAKKQGVDTSPYGCQTPLWLAPGYWAREVPALARFLILGY